MRRGGQRGARAAGYAAYVHRIDRAHVRKHERGQSSGRARARRCRRRDRRRRERVWERRASAPRLRSGTPYLRRMQFFTEVSFRTLALPGAYLQRFERCPFRIISYWEYICLVRRQGAWEHLDQHTSVIFLEHFRKKASLMQLRTLFGRLPKRVEMTGVCESLPGDAKTTASDSRARTSRRRDERRRERASSTPFSDASLMPVGLGDGTARLLCTRITALRRGGETFLWAEPAFA